MVGYSGNFVSPEMSYGGREGEERGSVCVCVCVCWESSGEGRKMNKGGVMSSIFMIQKQSPTESVKRLENVVFGTVST